MPQSLQTLFKDSLFFKSFSIIDEFGSVTRYSKNRPIKEENNLEHTGFVTLFSYLMGVDIQNRFEVELDFGKMLSGAVVHDIDETLTGDIPRPTKYFSKELRDKISEVEYSSICKIAEILEHIKTKKNLIDDWLNAKGTASVEQFIVKMMEPIKTKSQSEQRFWLFLHLT